MKRKILYQALFLLAPVCGCLANVHADTSYLFVSNEYNILVINSSDNDYESANTIVLVSNDITKSEITIPSFEEVKNLNLDKLAKDSDSLLVDVSYGGGKFLYNSKFVFRISNQKFNLISIDHRYFSPNIDPGHFKVNFIEPGGYSDETSGDVKSGVEGKYDLEVWIDMLINMSFW